MPTEGGKTGRKLTPKESGAETPMGKKHALHEHSNSKQRPTHHSTCHTYKARRPGNTGPPARKNKTPNQTRPRRSPMNCHPRQ
eukprot:4665087-Amphidinium_carterae.1